MKKLLALILVLALCGIASATDLYITDNAGNSEITVAPSDYVELLFWYTGEPVVISFDTDIDVSGPGTIIIPEPATAMLTATGRNTDYDYVWIPGMNEGAEFEITSSADAAPGLSAGILTPLAVMMFHCDDVGDVTITPIEVSLFDLNWNSIPGATYHAMIIHQIPEPATIALLCLGGLLLRKK